MPDRDQAFTPTLWDLREAIITLSIAQMQIAVGLQAVLKHVAPTAHDAPALEKAQKQLDGAYNDLATLTAKFLGQ